MLRVWFRLRLLLPYFCHLASGLVGAFWPTLFSGFRQMQTDPGDTRLLNFVLEYGYRWVAGLLTLRPISFWDQPTFFPAPNTTAYTEILLGTWPAYWLFRALRFAPETSFQLWMIAVLAVDFASMAVFLRRCVGFGTWASAVGAFLFAFASPRIAQLGHQQLLPQFFTILALYGLFRWIRPGRMTSEQGIYLFFVAFAVQLWSGFYLGWFFFFGLLVAGIWAVSLPRWRQLFLDHLARNRRVIVRAAALWLILIAPLAFHYILVRRAVGARPWPETATMLPPLQAWLYLGPQSGLYSWQWNLGVFRGISMEHEQRLGIGWVTLLLAAFGLYRLSRTRADWARLTALTTITILALITSYPGGVSIWKLLFHIVPGASAIRAVARMGLLIVIPLSIGLAYLVETRARIGAVLGIAIVCFAEQVQTTGAYDKFQPRVDVSSLAARVNKGCAAFYYAPVYEQDGRDVPAAWQLQIDAMWAALETGVPTINGYSGFHPKRWGDLADNRAFAGAAYSRIRDAFQKWMAYYHLDPERVCWIRSR